ncbi:MAG TPA: DNA topoisomerase [Polyangia bacterium]|nr:DNA topoisomerase [Polyangia bacterium]
MQLIVAEKPSVARDLARVLGVRGRGGKTAIENPARVITWCIGHLVELEEPAAYDSRWKPWRLDTLPMLPATFKLRPVEGTRDQLRAVTELMRDRRFVEVVNACDAGREGELIFRYVYALAGSRLPVRRLWISSLTDEAIRDGFAALRPGAAYDALGDAARCRSEADWLVGMNATRAVTVAARFATSRDRPPAPPPPGRPRGGKRAFAGAGDAPLYSIGRVQTPTLAIVVKRDDEIRDFRPRDYWEVRGTFAAGDGDGEAAGGAARFTATWGVAGADGKSVRSRLGTRALADGVLGRAGARGAVADADGPVVETLRQRRQREPPPLLFDLTSLQRTANRRFGLSASATLAAAQALYERHKILSYPRTDARHLPQAVGAELPKIAAALAALPAYQALTAPLLASPGPRPRRVFDDGKVRDHHAIIPTGKAIALGELSRDEGRVFDLVARRFLGAFHPDAEFALTDVVVRVGAAAADVVSAAPPAAEGAGADEAVFETLPPAPDRFFARGRVRLLAGWQAVAQLGEGRTAEPTAGKRGPRAEEGDAPGEPPPLPVLREGQRLGGTFDAAAKQTRPPPPHNEATLLGAMEYAGREIADETLRAAMRDFGLGTPATRAATIEILIRRGFIVRDGKQLRATERGASLIRTLPVKSLASPELTGQWEARLSRVARGEETRAAFMHDIAGYVRELVAAVARRPITVASGDGARGEAAPAAKPDGGAPPTTTRAAAAPALTCPRCREGTLVAGNRGWGCSRWREGCAFVVWFQASGQRITDTELADLIGKGRTRRRKWPGAAGAPVPGRLVLDVAAPRETGAARLETAAAGPNGGGD